MRAAAAALAAATVAATSWIAGCASSPAPRELLASGGGTLRRMDYPAFRVVSRPAVSLVRPETLATLTGLCDELLATHEAIAGADAHTLLHTLFAQGGHEVFARLPEPQQRAVARADAGGSDDRRDSRGCADHRCAAGTGPCRDKPNQTRRCNALTTNILDGKRGAGDVSLPLEQLGTEPTRTGTSLRDVLTLFPS